MGRMDIMTLGLTVLALVVFRIIWGFAGGHHARFVNFVRSPVAVVSWLRATRGTDAPRPAGHSPLAALSVIALLAVTGYLAMTGMFSTDGILFDGPLAHLTCVTLPDGQDHHYGKPALILLVLMHLAAILVYKFAKKTGLTKAMVTDRATKRPVRLQAPMTHQPQPACGRDGADGGTATGGACAALAASGLVVTSS